MRIDQWLGFQKTKMRDSHGDRSVLNLDCINIKQAIFVEYFCLPILSKWVLLGVY